MNKNLKKLFLMLADFCLVVLSYFLVILIIRDDFNDFIRTPQVFTSVLITGIGVLIAFDVVDFYSSLWMYAGTKEYALGMLAGLGVVSALGISAGFLNGFFLPHKYILTSGFVAIVFAICTRIGIKIAFLFMSDYFKKTNNAQTNLLVIDAGSAAALAIR